MLIITLILMSITIICIHPNFLTYLLFNKISSLFSFPLLNC